MAWDFLVKNGKIVDGTGSPWFRADVAIAHGRIAEIRPHLAGDARDVLEADGLFVCPGFIDTHTHSDFVFFVDPTAQSKVRQGVTTRSEGGRASSPSPPIRPLRNWRATPCRRSATGGGRNRRMS
jgi:N-acyl-D-aspartate/D-glutamate deacylase